MKKKRMLYQVYRKYYLDAEDIENSFEEDWKFAGSTYAVSEKQAINNVRNRIMGNISQYKPVAFGGKWENGYYWKAVSKRGVENDK